MEARNAAQHPELHRMALNVHRWRDAGLGPWKVTSFLHLEESCLHEIHSPMQEKFSYAMLRRSAEQESGIGQ